MHNIDENESYQTQQFGDISNDQWGHRSRLVAGAGAGVRIGITGLPTLDLHVSSGAFFGGYGPYLQDASEASHSARWPV
jgi:hypothetical protein